MKDLIEVYDGVLTVDQCQQWIDYMDNMERNSILLQEEDDRHRAVSYTHLTLPTKA